MTTDTEKNTNDSILYHSLKAKYYNELLIEQCKNWKQEPKKVSKKNTQKNTQINKENNNISKS